MLHVFFWYSCTYHDKIYFYTMVIYPWIKYIHTIYSNREYDYLFSSSKISLQNSILCLHDLMRWEVVAETVKISSRTQSEIGTSMALNIFIKLVIADGLILIRIREGRLFFCCVVSSRYWIHRPVSTLKTLIWIR